METAMTPNYSDQILRRFIVFEGLDGAGSTTQAQALVHRLQNAGHRVSLTAEPTAGPIGCLIRLILRGRLWACSEKEQTDRQLAHLFAADRFDHLYNAADGIEEQLRQGFIVVSTRYFFSSYAYNARTPAIFDLVDRLNRDFPRPELTVFLTVPLEESLRRLERRELRELYEQEDELARVETAYRRVLAPLGDSVMEYLSQGDREMLSQRIFDDVCARLQLPPPPK